MLDYARLFNDENFFHLYIPHTSAGSFCKFFMHDERRRRRRSADRLLAAAGQKEVNLQVLQQTRGF